MELNNLWDAAHTLLDVLGEDDSLNLAKQQKVAATLDEDCDTVELWTAISARMLILKNLRTDLSRI